VSQARRTTRCVGSVSWPIHPVSAKRVLLGRHALKAAMKIVVVVRPTPACILIVLAAVVYAGTAHETIISAEGDTQPTRRSAIIRRDIEVGQTQLGAYAERVAIHSHRHRTAPAGSCTIPHDSENLEEKPCGSHHVGKHHIANGEKCEPECSSGWSTKDAEFDCVNGEWKDPSGNAVTQDDVTCKQDTPAAGLLASATTPTNATSSNASTSSSDASNATNATATVAVTNAVTSIFDSIRNMIEGNVSSRPNTTSNATTNISSNVSSTTQAPGWDSVITTTTLAPGVMYVLPRTPVIHIGHQVSTITPDQWPDSFCVSMSFVAPRSTMPEAERCIALLGGNKTCGSFFIYINDVNEVGMGVRCETGAHTNNGLLKINGGLESGISSKLKFCYNMPTGNASIYRFGELEVSANRQWTFERDGKVSVFVGSHVFDVLPEALYEEDDAKLESLVIEDNRADTTWTTTTVMTTPRPHYEEVDMNATAPTDQDAIIIAQQRRRVVHTTPAPHWDNTHHDDRGNITKTLDNKSRVLHDEITTVTSSDTTRTETQSRVISVPQDPWPYGIQHPPDPWPYPTGEPPGADPAAAAVAAAAAASRSSPTAATTPAAPIADSAPSAAVPSAAAANATAASVTAAAAAAEPAAANATAAAAPDAVEVAARAALNATAPVAANVTAAPAAEAPTAANGTAGAAPSAVAEPPAVNGTAPAALLADWITMPTGTQAAA